MAEEHKIRDITFILKDLLKVIKVVTLYPDDNPLPTSLRRSFSEKLESIVEDYGDMSFSVDAETLTFEKEIVYESKSKEDNLAGLFYDAGITLVSFRDGLFVDEIYQFLDVIKKYLNSNPKNADMVVSANFKLGQLYEGKNNITNSLKYYKKTIATYRMLKKRTGEEAIAQAAESQFKLTYELYKKLRSIKIPKNPRSQQKRKRKSLLQRKRQKQRPNLKQKLNPKR